MPEDRDNKCLLSSGAHFQGLPAFCAWRQFVPGAEELPAVGEEILEQGSFQRLMMGCTEAPREEWLLSWQLPSLCHLSQALLYQTVFILTQEGFFQVLVPLPLSC